MGIHVVQSKLREIGVVEQVCVQIQEEEVEGLLVLSKQDMSRGAWSNYCTFGNCRSLQTN